MKKRKTANPKRRLRNAPGSKAETEVLAALAVAARYAGNPEHKRDPGDFGLSPPSRPRPGKTLCDGAGISTRAEAKSLLREGIRRGLVSVQARNHWPQNVWAVSEGGVALEGMLENQETGTYHGYPMLTDDPLREVVMTRWNLA